MEIVYKIFPYHALAIFQEVLLSFASHSGYPVAPLFHFFDFSLVGETHQADKQFEKELVVFTQVNGSNAFT